MTAATIWPLVRRVAILLAFVAVLLRPGIGEQDVPTQVADVEVLLVVDRTRSMAALDGRGGEPRILGAQEDLVALTEALPGARFGMITFGTQARLELPFTTDATTVVAAVETLRLEGEYAGSGSRADTPLALMTAVLERSAEQYPDRRRFVVFVGDGENTAEGEQASFAELGDLVEGGAVLGYGTEAGARMPSADDLSPDEGYVYDFDAAEDAVSHADLANLSTVADELGATYDARTEAGGMDAVADGFEAAYTADVDEDRPAKHDLTWVAGLVLLALLLLELRSGWRAVWTSRATLAPGGGAR